MNDDAELLRRYAREGANEAFAELVRRHVNLVYSAALRQLNGDAHLAADATQLVFADLARKAGKLVEHRVLAGWLFTSTRFVTAKLVRGERRRHAREQEAQLMQELTQNDPAAQLDWQRVRPVLDDVIGELSETDREAILLRFFEGRDYASVGARLQLADNTARMRVERALDKLRALLERRGVKSSSAALAVALANQAVVAAPAGLAATVAGAALTGGAATIALSVAGTGVAATGFMSITKLQLGLAGAVALTGATGWVIQADNNATLRSEVAELRQDAVVLANVQADNHRLARVASEMQEMQRDDVALARLQEEATGLRGRLQEIARTEEARRLSASRDKRTVYDVYDISMVDRQPTPRFQKPPRYPFEMKVAGQGGEVVVDFVVNATGEVQNARAVRSSNPEFEAAAVEAVQGWKFRPGAKGGQDVATHLQVPIVFTLNDDDADEKRAGATKTDGR